MTLDINGKKVEKKEEKKEKLNCFIYLRFNDRLFNIENLTYVGSDGRDCDIDELPYKEKDTIEAIYTANYILNYWEEYHLSHKDCLKVAKRARQIMKKGYCDEDEAIWYALDEYGFRAERDDE